MYSNNVLNFQESTTILNACTKKSGNSKYKPFEPEIIKIGQSSYKMYSNNVLNFQESMTLLNACTKKSGNLLNAPRIIKIIYLITHLVNLSVTQ